MSHKKGLSVDLRVNIALDALTIGEREGVSKLIQDRARFLKYVDEPGRSQKLSTGKALYQTKVGSSGLRLIYSVDGDLISVLDLMNERTMDQLRSKKKKKKKKKRGSPNDSASHSVVE